MAAAAALGDSFVLGSHFRIATKQPRSFEVCKMRREKYDRIHRTWAKVLARASESNEYVRLIFHVQPPLEARVVFVAIKVVGERENARI